MASEHYRELVWDYLYGLLDPTEAQVVRAHVESCPECRAALAGAESQQQMLARAARVITEVPVFHVPGQSHAPPHLGAVPEPPVPPEGSSATSTLPLLASKPRRSALRRFWPVCAAAAALLVTAFGLNQAYEEGLSRRRAQIAAARGKVGAADGLFAAFQADVATRQENKARRLREQLPPQLNVLAPAQVLSETPAVIRVATRDLDGKPRAADITASILEPGGKVLEKKVERIQGDGTIQVPAPKAGSSMRLRVEAKAEKGDAKIEETLQVVEPTLASHLALNKSVYNTGDVLYFRALTLDRYSLKPPAAPMPLRFALVDASGRSVKEIATQMRPGGISGGEMEITSDLPIGNYDFKVSAADSKNTLILPQSRGLEIIRDETPQVARNSDKKDNRAAQSFPVASAEKTIEFFPEGGDLVAGVSQRVYYRIRSPQREPAQSEGHVVLLGGGKALCQSEHSQGHGSFTFMPDPRESYAVRITGTPDTIIHNPFQKLGIKPEGVVLYAPQSVSRASTPLTVVLRNPGPARRLLLQATCRGQIVEQQYVDLQPGSQEVKLAPAAGAAGVVRLTVWEAAADRLVPAAERLLYLVPEKRLDVSCQLSGGAGPRPGGTNMTIKLHATDERLEAGQTWMLAAVVDEKYQRQKNERSLAAHFYLAGDVDAEELDNATLTLNDTPASRQALDLFLGTQGWRRFVAGQTPALLALREPLPANEAKATVPPGTAFFSLQNTTPQRLLDTYQKTWQKEVNQLVDSANQERGKLMDTRDASLQVLDQAVRELAEFEELPGMYFRFTLGVLTLALLVIGGGFLAVGLARLIGKGEKRPTAHFAVAFSCMFACIVLYVVVAGMPAANVHTDMLAAAPVTPWPEFSADSAKVATGGAEHSSGAPVAPAPAVGYFAAQAPRVAQNKDGSQLSLLNGASATDNLVKRNEGAIARAPSFSGNEAQNSPLQENRGANDPQRQLRQSAQDNVEMQRRFAQIAKAKEQVPGPPAPPASAMKPTVQAAAGAAAPGGAGGFGADRKAGEGLGKGGDTYFREYAYRAAQQRGRPGILDTLLWSPFLNCPDGQAQVSFDLPQIPATYRVLVYANSPSGGLGFYEGKLEVGPATQK